MNDVKAKLNEISKKIKDAEKRSLAARDGFALKKIVAEHLKKDYQFEVELQSKTVKTAYIQQLVILFGSALGLYGIQACIPLQAARWQAGTLGAAASLLSGLTARNLFHRCHSILT